MSAPSDHLARALLPPVYPDSASEDCPAHFPRRLAAPTSAVDLVLMTAAALASGLALLLLWQACTIAWGF